jgi:hypothetical protein
MTRALVRGESLLTQLLFDHALRLRMKDTTDDDEEKNEPSDAAQAASAPTITIDEPTEPVTGPAATNLTLTLDAGNQPLGDEDSPDGTEVDSTGGSKKGKGVDKGASEEDGAAKNRIGRED